VGWSACSPCNGLGRGRCTLWAGVRLGQNAPARAAAVHSTESSWRHCGSRSRAPASLPSCRSRCRRMPHRPRSSRTPLGLHSSQAVLGATALVVIVLAGAGLAERHQVRQDFEGSDALQSQVASIRLIPASSTLRRGCSRAARRLKVAVYCPTRVPARWSPRICAGCNGTFSATGWFPAPKGYVGQPGEQTGHFTVWAAPPRLIREGYVGCTNGTRSGHLRLARFRMVWITCPEGSTLDSGHIVLQWSRGRWTYALSLHTDTPPNRSILRTVARTVDKVP
jgi:hypothetical protein